MSSLFSPRERIGLFDVLREVATPETSSKPDFITVTGLITQSVARFRQAIQDLADVTRIGKNLTLDIDEIVVADLFEDVRLGLWRDISASHATIHVMTDGCPTVRFSRRNLRSILFNLISNALKYRSPERAPVIEISTSHINGNVALTVRDNGLGIAPEHHDMVFSMFRRLHHHVDGTGVGLYIVRRIVENAGGRIELESKEGKGSAFSVFLPEG